LNLHNVRINIRLREDVTDAHDVQQLSTTQSTDDNQTTVTNCRPATETVT